MVNMVQPDETDQQVQLLQGAMNDVYGMTDFEGAEPMDKKEFEFAYEVAHATVGTNEFNETHNELVMMRCSRDAG